MDVICWILLGGVIVAGVGLFVAYRQLCHVSDQLRLLRGSFRASILFELDRKYDDIFEGRKAARELADDIKGKMTAGGLEGEDEFLTELTSTLEEIWTSDKNRYFLIKQVFDFCEAVGYLMVCEYIELNDVDGLWGPAIKTWGHWFERHIAWRQQREGEDVYKYFILASAKLQQANKKPPA